MPLTRTDIADFTYFLAIARHGSFRRAAAELGVTTSALSHALKALEGRLGVRLLNRTSRSMTLTAAGEDLRDSITGPFAAIGEAYERLNTYRDTPAGKIRLNVIVDAAQLILAPVLPLFAERYPDIRIEITATDRMVDVIGEGFDAGIRHGGTVPEDMIAQRISPDLRWMVAASPAYLDRHGRPQSPADLAAHRCLGVRLGNEDIYRWEFMGPQGEFAVPVPNQAIVEDGRAMLALALNGFGLMYGAEPIFAPHVARGDLEFVLSDWSTTGPGYHIYYSSRRQVPTGLRLLIELIREVQPMGK